jgi:hypothetical protein
MPEPAAAARRSPPPARRCADPPAHVAMTMQSPLSPAADMPPDWLWAAIAISGNCTRSFKDFVGAAGQRQRYGDAERLGGLEVDNQFHLGGLLDR